MVFCSWVLLPPFALVVLTTTFSACCLAAFAKVSMDEADALMTVVNTIFRFSHWLILNGFIGGLGRVGDIDFSFVSDPSRPLGCAHSILPHAHGFGNTTRLLGPPDAENMFFQYLKILRKVVLRSLGSVQPNWDCIKSDSSCPRTGFRPDCVGQPYRVDGGMLPRRPSDLAFCGSFEVGLFAERPLLGVSVSAAS